jgi:hypothetical protein
MVRRYKERGERRGGDGRCELEEGSKTKYRKKEKEGGKRKEGWEEVNWRK